MKPLKLLLVTCLLMASVVQAASLVTLQLKNRPADEIIPIVEPMLAPGEVITGHGFKIFLRASAQTVSEVREMIDALDTAAKTLLISVFQGSKRELSTFSVSGNLRIDGDNASVGVGGSSGNNAGNIEYSDGRVSAGAGASSSEQRRQSNPVHRLRVTEGNEAFIQTGDQVPYSSADNGTTFKNVTTGFYVLPRIHGQSVTLQVSSFKNSLSGERSGNIETQGANTTVSGAIGEWIAIGGVSEHSSSSQSGLTSYSSSNSKRKDRIWIKAELVR